MCINTICTCYAGTNIKHMFNVLTDKVGLLYTMESYIGLHSLHAVLNIDIIKVQEFMYTC